MCERLAETGWRILADDELGGGHVRGLAVKTIARSDRKISGRFPVRRRIGVALAVVALLAGLLETMVVDARSARPDAFGAAMGMRTGGYLDRARFEGAERWLGRPFSWTVAMADRDSPKAMRSSAWGQLLAPDAVLPELSDRLSLVMTVPLAFGRATAYTEAGRATIRENLLRTASGAWDAHYRSVASSLVAAGYGDAVVRLGHESTGEFYPWSAVGNADAYIAAFRHVHDVMAAEGPQLRFEWNAARNTFERYGPPAYPGDRYVDVIGLDVYYEPWKGDAAPFTADFWSRRYERILKAHLDFATARGKPVSYAEWALGAVDEPEFIQRMHGWFRSLPTTGAGRLLYQSYFNEMGRPTYRLLNFPRSAQMYQSLFGPTAGLGGAGKGTAAVNLGESTGSTVAHTPPTFEGTTTTATAIIAPSTTAVSARAPDTTPATAVTGVIPPANSGVPTTATSAPPAARRSPVVEATFSHRSDAITEIVLDTPVRWTDAGGMRRAELRGRIELTERVPTTAIDLQLCFLHEGSREQACSRRVALPDRVPGVLADVGFGPLEGWWTSPGWDWERPASSVRILFKDSGASTLLNTSRCGSSCSTVSLPAGTLVAGRLTVHEGATSTG